MSPAQGFRLTNCTTLRPPSLNRTDFVDHSTPPTEPHRIQSKQAYEDDDPGQYPKYDPVQHIPILPEHALCRAGYINPSWYGPIPWTAESVQLSDLACTNCPTLNTALHLRQTQRTATGCRSRPGTGNATIKLRPSLPSPGRCPHSSQTSARAINLRRKALSTRLLQR